MYRLRAVSRLNVPEIVVDIDHDASELDVGVFEGVNDPKATFEHHLEDDVFVFNHPSVLFADLHQIVTNVLDTDVFVLGIRVDVLQELCDATDAVVWKLLRWLTQWL
jgi:uncharacterized protein (UPF0264 family)